MNPTPPEANPFASPTAEDAPATPSHPAASSVEDERRRLLSHEASVRSIGSLYYLGAFLVGAGAAAAISGAVATGDTAVLLPTLGVLGVAAVIAAVGYGLRNLKSWARLPAIFFSVLGLFAILAPNLIIVGLNVYFLVLLGSEKGRQVFSPEYGR